MYKVLIIDDDVPMLKYLKQLIDWNALGLQIVADTYSSVKALRLFDELRPDLVVSDIGLPQMDGLELASEMLRRRPEVRVIFLTCHEDFHYAQKALKLSVDDYLIKDELTADQLAQSLEKSVRLIRAAKAQTEQLTYREDWSRHANVLRDSFFKQLLRGGEAAYLTDSAGRLGLVWDQPSFLLALGYVSYYDVLSRYAHKDLPLIRYGVANIAAELASEFEGITTFNDGEGLAVLLNYRPSLKWNAQEHLLAFLAKLQAKCKEFLGVGTTFFASSSTDKLAVTEIGAVHRRMAAQRYAAFYTEHPVTVLPAAGLPQAYHPGAGGFEQECAELSQAVRDHDEALLEKALAGIRRSALEMRPEPASFVHQCADRLRLVELQYRAFSGETLYACLQQTLTLGDALGLMGLKLRQIMNGRRLGEPQASKEPKLQTIDQYIAQHLAETITSIDIATHLYLNPSYFSRYFKKLSGENFTDYVHRYKMKIAADLLEKTKDSIEVVALRCGYSDRTYFSKVFKKYIGVTPGEYKSRSGLM
ncbi:response regulator [Paenibacillus tyrfis]|uniref:AraC family transcriptional regulator n=1 Tax=Paenibacillus tyrfis TaxID=1501230 RepID=A0A081P094_9BACL|nr:response regulator [Paenibacillus tyrfis]KEQ24117.1 hypothetical protein ET33_10450 [Paenibacillus tyrfis]